MEIGDQGVDHLKLVARIDKDLCPAAFCLKDTIFICGRLQGPAACGSHRDYPFSRLFRIVDQFCLIFFHHIELGMHMMIFYIIYLYRAEGSQSYMKGYMGDLHPFFFNLLKKLLGKTEEAPW